MSAANKWYMKQNDQLPAISATLYGADGAIVNLTTAVSAKFLMRDHTTLASKVTSAATIASASFGLVTYAWTAGDTDTAGRYDAEWEITWPSGRKQTFPSVGYDTVIITDDIG